MNEKPARPSLERLLGRCAAPAMMLVLMLPGEAAADFRLCNNTSSRVGIAIGYRDKESWLTEGWWNVASRSCETILKGPLAARFYYVYAVDYDQGGEWGGQSFMCTRDKEFTIRGFQDCLARGYERTGFFEIDSLEQRSWTVQLSDQALTSTTPNAEAVTPGTDVAPVARPPEPKLDEDKPKTDTEPVPPQ